MCVVKSKAPQKILYILTKSDLGGVSKYILEITKGLPKNITPYYIMSSSGYLSDELKKIGIKEEQIFFVSMTNSIIDLKTHIKSNIETIKIIKQIQPDLIHCNSMTGGIVGRVSGALTKIPVIFTAHGWTFSGGYSAPKIVFYKILETLLAFLTKKIICVSEYDRQIGIKTMPFFRNKMITIYNGISDIQEEYRKKEFSKDELKIVMIARFANPKDPYTLIFAVQELIEGYNIKLDLYGYGEELDKVVNCINNQSNENIKYKGEISDVIPILKNYDIYALISKKEGLPIGVLEAMQCGLPLLLSDVGGMTELIEGNGLYVKSQDVMDCKKQIKALWDNRKNFDIMGQKSRKLYEENFIAKKMINTIIETYEGLNV